jgi:hypothetical protein
MAGIICVCVLVCIFGTSAAAPKSATEPLNVKEFGAKGDGHTDDTTAINAAFNEMRKAGYGARIDPPIGRALGSCPTVYFPTGNYIISDVIDIGGANLIRGENAIINQATPGKDIFAGNYNIATHVSGFKFVNGRNQVWLNNPNLGAFLKVTDCEFHGATGIAVIFGYECNSTLAFLERCLFIHCEQWIYTMADVSTFRDIHGMSRTGMSNKAAFDIHGGIVTMDNIMATPLCNGVDQRWIDNYSHMLKVSNWRFGGEGGGFTPIVNFTKYNTFITNSIVIDNCFLPNQSNIKRQAVVYCEEVPNRVIIKNSNILGIPPIIVDKRINLKDYFKGVTPGQLDFAMEHCTGAVGDVPPLLKHPVINEDPGKKFLSDEEVRPLMDAAIKKVREGTLKRIVEIPAEFRGHTEQTGPANYMEVTYDTYEWTLTGYADAETVKNEKYFSIAPVSDDVIIMRRSPNTGNAWVLVKNVTIDLDKYPILSYKIKVPEGARGGSELPALRLIETETKNAAMMPAGRGKNASSYYAQDLRKFFGGGTHTFDIRVYYSGTAYFAEGDPENPSEKGHYFKGEPAGTYTVIDYIRAEAE